MLDCYFGIFLDRTGRDDVEVQRALLDAMLHLGVRLATAPHEPRIVPVRSRVHAHLGAVSWQAIKEDERPRSLGVLSTTLRMLRPMLRTEHVLAA